VVKCNAASSRGSRHVEGNFQPTEHAKPLLLETDRVLITPVKQVVDPREEGNAAPEIVGGRQVLSAYRASSAAPMPIPTD